MVKSLLLANNINRFAKGSFCKKFICLSFSNTVTNRERMVYDVVTVGAGPAGLSCAIRLKQLAISNKIDLNICVVEKGAEIGAHILSGNVFETKALDELFPSWREENAPINTIVEQDEFLILTEKNSYKIPNILLPNQLHNHNNYIISLSKLVRWLASKAEELGIEIYPGFAVSEILYNDSGEVIGVATKDSGIAKDGTLKDTYTSGVELLAKQTVFAEGCRGSCTEEIISKYNLREGKDVQSYGLGIKEVWQIPSSSHKKGFVQHSIGWPLQSSVLSDVYGGSFLYHGEDNTVMLGLVIGLDYSNPFINPYKEFQRWKTHPSIRKHIENGECIAYGARCINEGGYHAIPKLSFPGGLIVGCAAGFGSHTAMKSGILAAESIFDLLFRENIDTPVEILTYEDKLKRSWIGRELYEIRNTHASFHHGLIFGILHTAFSCFISKGLEPWTLTNKIADSERTKPADKYKEIVYPKADGVITFDLLANLIRSGTFHDHDQPSHLVVKDELKDVPTNISIKIYSGPEQRFCPANVYEYIDSDDGSKQLVINSQNCIHCKCCSIKTPKEYIKWTVPEGSGGPNYTIM